MREPAVRERLGRVLAQQLDGRPEPDHLKDDTPLYARGLGLNSLDLVALIVRIEEEFDLFLEAEEVGEGIETFGALARMIEHKLVATNGGGSGQR